MRSQINMKIRRQIIYLAVTGLLLVLTAAGWVSLRQSFGRLAGDFLYPYLISVRYTVDTLSNQTLLLFSRRELAGQLEMLQQENRRLASQAASAAELLVENDNLRRMMKLEPPPSWQYINAEIILRDPRFWNERVSIDRGSVHGVKSGSAVLTATPDGQLQFVGAVDKVNRRTAEIITVYNRSLRMSAYLPGSGAIGVINADSTPDNKGEVSIGFLPLSKSYTPGEALLTSGFERQIPAGIRIGTLSTVCQENSLFSSRRYLHGTILPAVQLSNIRFVIIADRADLTQEDER